jgi:hypothetical protein
VTEKVEDTSQFGKIRKDIARLLTERRTPISKHARPAASPPRKLRRRRNHAKKGRPD